LAVQIRARSVFTNRRQNPVRLPTLRLRTPASPTCLGARSRNIHIERPMARANAERFLPHPDNGRGEKEADRKGRDRPGSASLQRRAVARARAGHAPRQRAVRTGDPTGARAGAATEAVARPLAPAPPTAPRPDRAPTAGAPVAGSAPPRRGRPRKRRRSGGRVEVDPRSHRISTIASWQRHKLSFKSWCQIIVPHPQSPDSCHWFLVAPPARTAAVPRSPITVHTAARRGHRTAPHRLMVPRRTAAAGPPPPSTSTRPAGRTRAATARPQRLVPCGRPSASVGRQCQHSRPRGRHTPRRAPLTSKSGCQPTSYTYGTARRHRASIWPAQNPGADTLHVSSRARTDRVPGPRPWERRP